MSPPRRRKAPERPYQLCEAEVVAGLKDQAASELRTRFGSDARLLRKERPDELPFHFRGDLAALGTVGKSNAINLVQHFDIPRPAAFLGHQHLTRLLRQIDVVRSLQDSGSFHSFRISAAGRDSGVMQRLRDAIAGQTNLVYDEREGDLLLRIRKADLHQAGWELLTRLTPRPLSARTWRVRNLPGALNATIAAAMIELTHPQPEDRFFNLMCGSGTLLVERLLRAPLLAAAGCDTDPHALRCAADNLDAAGAAELAQLFHDGCDPTSIAGRQHRRSLRGPALGPVARFARKQPDPLPAGAGRGGPGGGAWRARRLHHARNPFDGAHAA